MKHNVADFKLVVAGIDYAAQIVPRLISLTLAEKLGEEADTLDIQLSNHDGQLAPIKRGVYATLSLGWKSGPDVIVGLVDKGQFKVDQVEKSGPPDVLSIRARSADLTGDYRRRRDKGWKDTTLGAVVQAGGSLPVIGFDNTPVSAAMGFSSVDQRLDEVASGVLALLTDAGGEASADTARHRLVTPELVVRSPHPPASWA